MATTYFYIDEYTDECLSCAPTLEGWAAWLAADIRDEWNREGPIAAGTEFTASRLTDLGTISLVRDPETKDWGHVAQIPEGTDTYFLRYGAGGWDADFSGNTIDDALTDLDDDEADLACVMTEGDVRVRLDLTPLGPVLIVIGSVN